MNTKIYIVLSVFLAIGVASCNLDRLPTDAVSPGTFFNTESDLKLYTNSFYNMLPSAEGVYNERIDNIITTGLSEEVQGSRQVPTSGGGWSWGNLRNINFFLQNSYKCKDEAARERYDGLARFFRAYFYLGMVQRFGDVPWYSEVIDENDLVALQRPRDSRTLIMDSIIADIDFAIEKLPSSTTVNEVSKWTALALKSRIGLFEGTFRKYHAEFAIANAEQFLNYAVSASEALMLGNKYTLYSTGNPSQDYLNLFASNDPITDEVILARSFSAEFTVYHNLNYYTLTASYGKPGLEKKLVNSYLMEDGSRFTDLAGYRTMGFLEETSNRDPRLSQTIRTPGYMRIGEDAELAPDYGATMTGYQIIKYVTERSNDTNNRSKNAMPIFRYAEALLNYAEAKAELGELTQNDLDISINLIRKRAGMPNLLITDAEANPDSYLATQYPLVTGSFVGSILEIRRERRIELMMENFRWTDILRWKSGALLSEVFKGVYFPALGPYDLTGNGVNDIYLYQGSKPSPAESGVQYLKVGSDIELDQGTSGNIIVNAQIDKVWDENKDYFYPIPIQDRLLNPNLTQNPGWDDGLN